MSFLTAADLRTYLRVTSDDSWDDLEVISAAARQAVEDRCGAVDVRVITGERLTSAALSFGPVVELLSLSRDGSALSVADYYVGLGGVLTAASGATFPSGLIVSYRVGRDPAPEWAVLSARIIARHLWRTQRPSRTGAEDQSSGFAIPRAAETLMAPHALFGVA